MKITRWKGDTDKGLLREPLKKQLIRRLEQTGLDFAHGWVHEEGGSIRAVKIGDKITSDVIYEPEVITTPYHEQRIRYIWLEFTNLIAECPRHITSVITSDLDCYIDLWERRTWSLPNCMCLGVRITEQPIYVLFIEVDGILYPQQVVSFESCSYHAFGVEDIDKRYDYKMYFNGISLILQQTIAEIMEYIRIMEEGSPGSFCEPCAMDVLIDQENPFFMVVILAFFFKRVIYDSETFTYYVTVKFYNAAVPITLVKAGKTEIGTQSNNTWNVFHIYSMQKDNQYFYGAMPSLITYNLNQNFISNYLNDFSIIYPPNMDLDDIPTIITSNYLIISNAMFPSRFFLQPYDVPGVGIHPPLYTLIPIVGNWTFVDSPHIYECEFAYYYEWCEGRDEYNPSFELVNGVLYRTREFYLPSHPYLPDTHAVKTLKNHPLGLEHKWVEWWHGEGPLLHYTSVSEFHDDFINVASDEYYVTTYTEFRVSYGRPLLYGVDVEYTGHKRLYIYPNLIQLDFALGHRLEAQYDAQEPQHNDEVIERLINALEININQTSIFGFILTNNNVIAYDENNLLFNHLRGGFNNCSFFGGHFEVTVRCPESPYPPDPPYTFDPGLAISGSLYCLKLINGLLYKKEAGCIIYPACDIYNAEYFCIERPEEWIDFPNKIKVNVIEPLVKANRGGILYPEIHTSKFKEFNICFSNGLFLICIGLSEDDEDYVYLKKNVFEECFPPTAVPARNMSIMSFLRGVHILGERGYEYFSFWEGEQDLIQQYPPYYPEI